MNKKSNQIKLLNQRQIALHLFIQPLKTSFFPSSFKFSSKFSLFSLIYCIFFFIVEQYCRTKKSFIENFHPTRDTSRSTIQKSCKQYKRSEKRKDVKKKRFENMLIYSGVTNIYLSFNVNSYLGSSLVACHCSCFRLTAMCLSISCLFGVFFSCIRCVQMFVLPFAWLRIFFWTESFVVLYVRGSVTALNIPAIKSDKTVVSKITSESMRRTTWFFFSVWKCVGKWQQINRKDVRVNMVGCMSRNGT